MNKGPFHKWLRTNLSDDSYLSTVRLPIEHPGGTWYESLVFGGEHDATMRRYKTEKEAIAGHKEMAKYLKEPVC